MKLQIAGVMCEVSHTGSTTPFWIEQKANIIVTLVEIMLSEL
jgi:hypothetical protein